MLQVDDKHPYRIQYHTMGKIKREKFVSVDYNGYKDLVKEEEKGEIQITYVMVADPMNSIGYTNIYNNPEE